MVAPFREETAAGRYLDRRGGAGGYMVILQCDDIAARQARCETLGVRVINHMQYGTYDGLQLHPRDTGGAILETSCSAGNGAPDGPRHPVGKNWRDAMRTNRVPAIAAADLQSDDPAALAARWGDILAIDPVCDGGGTTILPLENAVLRFVAATDGRGEGLGGLDIRVADRAAVIATAEERGCPVSGDTVTVCGTRFRMI